MQGLIKHFQVYYSTLYITIELSELKSTVEYLI